MKKLLLLFLDPFMVDDNLTGIAISMGAGMCNIAVMYAGMPGLTFAVTRGGDWVDENVSADTRVSKPKVQNIKESATLGITDDFFGENIKSFVVLFKNKKVEEKKILNFCRKKLGFFKSPIKIQFLEKLPKTQSGKILKRILK